MRENYLDSLAKLLDTYEGRHVAWELMALCGVFQNSALVNTERGISLIDDEKHISFNLGKQFIGQQIFSDISPDTFRLMQGESKVRNEKFMAELKEKEGNNAKENGLADVLRGND